MLLPHPPSPALAPDLAAVCPFMTVAWGTEHLPRASQALGGTMTYHHGWPVCHTTPRRPPSPCPPAPL